MLFFFAIIGLSIVLTIGISMLMPLIAAQPPALSIPVDCTLGQSCFIQNYVDLDPSENWTDYRCGPMSYNNNDGVDFRLRNLAQMRSGVKVLAAADGTVLRLRDDAEDISIRAANAPEIKGEECGNAVVIGHNGGYETQYCHLKKGSLKVRSGQQIKRGEVLGEIGLSGLTEFPHVHFMLRSKDGEIIDPFAGEKSGAHCDANDYHGHYWQSGAKKNLPYIPTALLNVGISTTLPTAAKAQEGTPAQTHIAADAPAMLFWTEIMGLQKDDHVIMKISAANGTPLISHNTTIDRNKANWFQYIGKKRPKGNWTAGHYLGQIDVIRSAKPILSEHYAFDVIAVPAGAANK